MFGGIAAVIPIVAGVFATPASAAAAATETSVTISIDAGALFPLGDATGTHHFFGPGETGLAGIPSDVRVGVGVSGEWPGYEFNFTAPVGQDLQVGVYEDVAANNFEDHAGMSITGYGFPDCYVFENGRFEVKRITTTEDGTVDSLWIVYEQHCSGRSHAVFGEIRYAVPDTPGVALVAPQQIRWPAVESDDVSSIVPITVTNPSPHRLKVGTSYLTGPDQEAFSITTDECAGVTLGPTGSCVVRVWFAGEPSDPRRATLVVPELDGSDHHIPLEGRAFFGSTRVVMRSEKGDPIGRGKDYEYSFANSSIGLFYSTPESVWFEVIGRDDNFWMLALGAKEPLKEGETYRARKRDADSSGGLDIDVGERSCDRALGRFTVTTLDLSPEGEIREVGISFRHRCRGSEAGLTGVLEFRLRSGS